MTSKAKDVCGGIIVRLRMNSDEHDCRCTSRDGSERSPFLPESVRLLHVGRKAEAPCAQLRIRAALATV